MPEWLTYSLRDFLMFGPDVYWRLYELHNLAIWPLPLFSLLAGILVLLLLTSRHHSATRLACCVTALSWLGASCFLAIHYAPINWPVGYAIWLFPAQTVLMIVAAVYHDARPPSQARRPSRIAGWSLLVLAVLLYPILGSVFGRDLAQAQTFGIAPDPTAVASLGLIELVKAGRWILPLSIIPVSWCLFSGVTLMTLNAPEGWLLFSALGVWLASRLAAFREPGTND